MIALDHDALGAKPITPGMRAALLAQTGIDENGFALSISPPQDLGTFTWQGITWTAGRTTPSSGVTSAKWCSGQTHAAVALSRRKILAEIFAELDAASAATPADAEAQCLFRRCWRTEFSAENVPAA